MKKMGSMMIFQAQSIKDLLFAGNTLFHKICIFGHLKLLKFFASSMDKNAFVDCIFQPDAIDNKPIDFAITNLRSSVVKYLLEMEEVRNRFQNDDQLKFRTCFFLFALSSEVITDYVLTVLNIGKEDVINLIDYNPVTGGDRFNRYGLLCGIVWFGTYEAFLRFCNFIGKEAFIENAFVPDAYGDDVMEYCIQYKKMKCLEHVLSFDEIKNQYMTDNDKLFRLVQKFNRYIEYKEVVKYIVDNIGLTEAKLKELKAYRDISIENIIPFTK